VSVGHAVAEVMGFALGMVVPVVVVDVCWGTFVTAVSATVGLMLTNLIAREI